MSDIVPRGRLAKQAMVGIGATGGGIALLALAGNPVFSIVAGAVLLVAGLALSTGKSDRTIGIVGAVVGAAAVVAGLLPGRDIITVLMRIAGFLSIGGGVYQLVRFFIDLKKRS